MSSAEKLRLLRRTICIECVYLKTCVVNVPNTLSYADSEPLRPTELRPNTACLIPELMVQLSHHIRSIARRYGCSNVDTSHSLCSHGHYKCSRPLRYLKTGPVMSCSGVVQQTFSCNGVHSSRILGVPRRR